MRRVLSLGLLSALAAVFQARSETFTGAYIGLNAGYGLERGRETKRPDAVPGSNASGAGSTELPPSAAGAAKSLQQHRPASR